MEWYAIVFEVIDMRSFSNLWFWIALAVLWSTASHWVLGVPYDLVLRARRRGGEAAEDVHLLVGVYTRRLLHVAEVSGIWLVAALCFALTMLAMLGFWYRLEFAQALFCLALPMALVGVLSLRAARRIAAGGLHGETLYRALARHRLGVQALGMLSIFVTAMWGMYQNLNLGAF